MARKNFLVEVFLGNTRKFHEILEAEDSDSAEKQIDHKYWREGMVDVVGIDEISPRQIALIGIIWLGIRLDRENGGVDEASLGNLQQVILKSQNLGHILPELSFNFERTEHPEPYSMDLEKEVESLDLLGFEGDHIWFTDSPFFGGIFSLFLPTTIFRDFQIFPVIDIWKEQFGLKPNFKSDEFDPDGEFADIEVDPHSEPE